MIVIMLFFVGGLIWMATGIYQVQPGELAALRRLGKFDGTQGPGLKWFWPAPIGTRDIVKVSEIKRLELGLRGSQPVPAESLMITGDENIVDAQLLVQFDIKDIEKYLFRAVDPAGLTLKDVAETSLRKVVGSRAIDDVLTIEKEAVQAETKTLMQELMDVYNTGIRIREVKLLAVNPPSQVQDAFDDVVRAKEDKERTIRLAEAYREDIIPKAKGEASKKLELAEGFRQEVIANAEGESQRFLSVLEEYIKSEDVTRRRLYLEAMEEVLPNVTIRIVPSDATLVVSQLGGVVTPLPER